MLSKVFSLPLTLSSIGNVLQCRYFARTASSVYAIWYSYRHEMKSQTLWEEVAIAVKAFAEPLTALYKVHF
jgi:hypothetical protein